MSNQHKDCVVCGKTFYNHRIDKKGHRISKYTKRDWESAKYCSYKCYWLTLKGTQPPLQGIVTGKKCKSCRTVYFRKGKTAREKSNYCSKSCAMQGEAHWNWKGGKTSVNHRLRNTQEYKAWRDAVYKRDCWTCQHCNYKGKDIVAHHIKPFNEYPKLRHTVSNGITLCRPCHKNVHSEIGVSTRFQKVA